MRFWMVRAGEGGYLAETFERESLVAMGFRGRGDLTRIRSLGEMRERFQTPMGEEKAGALANQIAMAWKFRGEMSKGDPIVTYDGARRDYLLGTIAGDYRFAPGVAGEYEHIRPVKWEGWISRDRLGTAAKNTLGSTLGLFEPGLDVLEELRRAGREPGPVQDAEEELTRAEESAVDDLRRDLSAKAHEFIKDRIQALAPDDMEGLVAGLLGAMGYRARVSKKGPDRGRDIVASPDGLGLQEPRIMVEVKHRQSPMGAPEIRSFLGSLRTPARGLYVSTGGFTREAHYEAERAAVPVTLIDLDDLAELVTDHYEAFDLDARALLPLVRMYWPVG